MHTTTPVPGIFGAFFGLFIFVWFFFVAVGIFGSIFWIWMLIHAATNEIKDKVVWVLVLIFTHIIGAVIYYFVVKRPFDQAHSAANVPPPQQPPVDPTKTI